MSRIQLRPLTLAAIALLAAVLALGAAACGDDDAPGPTPTPVADQIPATATDVASADELTITSSAFGDNETIPVLYTCDGENISPPLAIAGVPDDAAALALLVDDPDAPGGSFVHWTVANIDPATTEVPEDSAPPGGIEGLNGAQQPGYIGSCPPSGEHRYTFTLYALDEALALEAGAFDKEALLAAVEGHVLAEVTLTGLYER